MKYSLQQGQREKMFSEKGTKGKNWVVMVGLASCGIAAGGRKVYSAFTNRLADRRLNVVLKSTGCIGMCYNEVLVDVSSPDGEHIFYNHVTPERVERIVEEHLVAGKPVTEWVIPALEIDSVFAKQKRIVLRNCGVIDPESIDDYVKAGGYKSIAKALGSLSPDEVIAEVSKSGLRGRGGAGFPTGTKWGFTRKAPGSIKYVICNADEGDPGAFMDRSVLESDPHSILEGMLIAGYAIGASEGYIYARAEYPLAIQRLEDALSQARERGFIGENILGHDFDFDISIRQGAGACSGDTAVAG